MDNRHLIPLYCVARVRTVPFHMLRDAAVSCSILLAGKTLQIYIYIFERKPCNLIKEMPYSGRLPAT